MFSLRRCLAVLLIGTVLALAWRIPAEAAASTYLGSTSPTSGSSPADAKLSLDAPTDWTACWSSETGLSEDLVSTVLATVYPDALVTDLQLRLPPRLARTTFFVPGSPNVPLDALLDAEVPVWRATSLSDHVLSGEILSVTVGVDGCLPYPVRSVSMTAQPLVRGRTAALVIETDGLAFCRVSYLDHSERCQREGMTHQVVLIAVSALEEPGIYPLEVALVSGGNEVAFTLPLTVSSGRYGFQYIAPLPGLSGLMDAHLMATEAAYLTQWRGLRSQQRRWQFPLGFPLEQLVSISADYGDRRSYGGMVSGYHSGVDYRAWTGLPVVAPADGTVVMAETLNARGNAVLIDHGWGLVTGYWHLSRIDVQVGDVVRRGERFAAVGNTGLSTGSHLHWEVWVNGVSVDGKQWLDADGLQGVVFDNPEDSRPLIEAMELE